jgi:hypothetical protein
VAGSAAAVLAAVPLVDARGRTHAVVAIRDVPFASLHPETLELFAVLGGRVGDCIALGAQARSPRRAELPDPRSASMPVPDAVVVPARVEEAA